MHILVIGGTGFIGRSLIGRLCGAGHQVLVPTRLYARGRDLLVQPTATVIEANVHDDARLDRLMSGCDVVINLAGTLQSGRGTPYGAEFARMHVALPERIALACRRNGVPRLLHMSALGADSDGASMYLRSRGDGEAAVRRVFAAWPQGQLTIFRPSVVFGPQDRFMNLFAALARWAPVLPLAGAGGRMQPVYVEDVAQAYMVALENSHTIGHTYELAGPRVYTLGELARLATEWSGRPRRVLALPRIVGRLQACVLEMLPGPPLLSRDNLDSLSVDNVSAHPFGPELGIVPTPLESVAPSYLAHR